MNPFIKQTAIDYDLPYEVVESIYNKFSSDLFYIKLEEHLKTIRNLK